MEWCDSRHVTPLPAEPVVVADYIAKRATEGSKVATIAVALAAITEAHRVAGFDSPRGSATVKHVWRGIRREAGVAPTEKAPMLATEVRRFVKAIGGDLRSIRDRAIVLLGLASACRRSELVALDVDDLVFVPEGIEVHVRRSKTDQEGRGSTKNICFGSDPSTCPVRAARAWLDASGIVEGPVFRRIVRGGQAGPARLDARALSRVVKRAAVVNGLDPSKNDVGQDLDKDGFANGEEINHIFAPGICHRGTSNRSSAGETAGPATKSAEAGV